MVAALVLVASCGGGGTSGSATPPGATLGCDPNSQGIQLARPSPGQAGVSTTTSVIEIVDDGNLDQLYSLTPQFDLKLTDNSGNVSQTSSLVEVQDAGGPHPYGANSFFYEASLTQSLQAGRTYSVTLNATTVSCTPLMTGTFST
jgi:hypothetical protein